MQGTDARWWWYVGRWGPIRNVASDIRDRIPAIVWSQTLLSDPRESALAVRYAAWQVKQQIVMLVANVAVAVAAVVYGLASDFAGIWTLACIAAVVAAAAGWRWRAARTYIEKVEKLAGT
jgi:hypothetical protein